MAEDLTPEMAAYHGVVGDRFIQWGGSGDLAGAFATAVLAVPHPEVEQLRAEIAAATSAVTREQIDLHRWRDDPPETRVTDLGTGQFLEYRCGCGDWIEFDEWPEHLAAALGLTVTDEP